MSIESFDRNKHGQPSRRFRFLSSQGNHSLSAEQISEKRALEEYLQACAVRADVKLKKAVLAGVPEIQMIYDISYGSKKLGYLLKQWNSSMLRLGCNIVLRRNSKDLSDNFRKIHHLCSVNHITLLFPPVDLNDVKIPISLETAIFLESLNERVLKEAVLRFAKCKDLLRPLLRNP